MSREDEKSGSYPALGDQDWKGRNQEQDEGQGQGQGQERQPLLVKVPDSDSDSDQLGGYKNPLPTASPTASLATTNAFSPTAPSDGDSPSNLQVARAFAAGRVKIEAEDKENEIYFCFSVATWRTIFKGLNLTYAGSAALVFAFMSYFREEKNNEHFGSFTGWGLLNGTSSYSVNVPMSYFFSYKVIELLDKVFHPNDPERGNRYLTAAFVPSAILGLSTTFAGIELSNASLSWMPNWLAVIITLDFGWNNITTRMLPTTMVTYNGVKAIAKRSMQRYHRDNEYSKPIFDLLADLERFGPRVGRIRSTKYKQLKWSDSATLKSIHLECTKAFYAALSKEECSETITKTEGIVGLLSTATSTILATMAFVSLVLWLSLSENGLNEVAKWFGSEGWGESRTLTWLCSISNLFLYMRSAWNYSGMLISVFHRPALKRYYQHHSYATLKKTGVVLSLAIFFSLLAYPSGAGYAKMAADRIQGGFGSVAEAFLASDNGLAQLCQLLFSWFKPSWSDKSYQAFFYYLISGCIVNGWSAFHGFLSYSPQWVQSIFACLFDQPLGLLSEPGPRKEGTVYVGRTVVHVNKGSGLGDEEIYYLDYEVVGVNEKLHSAQIPYSELPKEFPKNFTNVKTIMPYLKDILRVTTERGHTEPEIDCSKWHDLIEQQLLHHQFDDIFHEDIAKTISGAREDWISVSNAKKSNYSHASSTLFTQQSSTGSLSEGNDDLDSRNAYSPVGGESGYCCSPCF